MAHSFADIAFTDSVRQAQRRYTGEERRGGAFDRPRGELGAREIDFLAGRDSFFMATVSETGWPYVQHRGGPAGFLRVLAPARLGFADYAGNRQYVSTGNLAHDGRVCLILIDFATGGRLKILGRARVVDAAAAPPGLAAAVVPAEAPARVERLVLVEVEAFDWNCSQHIPRRYSESEWRARFDQPVPTRSGL